MSISLAKPVVPAIPVPSGTPYIPSNVQAQGQVIGNVFTNSIITTSSTTGGWYSSPQVITVNAVPPPRKPRRPREKRQIPLFTAGLEAKLNKNLDKDATKILRYIARKVEQEPTIVDSINHFVYEFNALFQYAYQTGGSWNTFQLPQMSHHIVKFFARLIIRNDGTLREFEIRMAGERS